MKKRKPSIGNSPINLPRRLQAGLAEAEELLAQGSTQGALSLLHELDDRFPGQSEVLGLMANAHLDTENHHGYLQAIYRLHELVPNRAEVKLGLAGAYLTNGYLALALRTFRQFQKRWPRDERVSDVQKALQQLEKSMEEILTALGDVYGVRLSETL